MTQALGNLCSPPLLPRCSIYYLGWRLLNQTRLVCVFFIFPPKSPPFPTSRLQLFLCGFLRLFASPPPSPIPSPFPFSSPFPFPLLPSLTFPLPSPFPSSSSFLFPLLPSFPFPLPSPFPFCVPSFASNPVLVPAPFPSPPPFTS